MCMYEYVYMHTYVHVLVNVYSLFSNMTRKDLTDVKNSKQNLVFDLNKFLTKRNK